MSPIPEAPGEALNTDVGPALGEQGIDEARLVQGTGKALERDGESQVQATSRTVRKISMALISKKGLKVKKSVILSHVIAEDHMQPVSQAAVDKDTCATRRVSLPALANTGLA